MFTGSRVCRMRIGSIVTTNDKPHSTGIHCGETAGGDGEVFDTLSGDVCNRLEVLVEMQDCGLSNSVIAAMNGSGIEGA